MKSMTTASDVKSYLEDVLPIAFQDEIRAYIELSKDSKAENIVTYNEIALLSILKTALTRKQDSSEVWAIQEYSVFNSKNEFQGRGDLFVMFRKDKLNCDVLFEAKRLEQYKPSNSDTSWEKYILNTIDQGSRYIEVEENYFSEPSFLVTIFFETVSLINRDGYKKLRTIEVKGNRSFEFYINSRNRSLSNELHLCIYGYIKKIEFKTL